MNELRIRWGILFGESFTTTMTQNLIWKGFTKKKYTHFMQIKNFTLFTKHCHPRVRDYLLKLEEADGRQRIF